MLTLIRTEEDTTMTAITHNPETNWGFTVGNQPYTGYVTRDAAAEALYDLEKGGAAYDAPERAVQVALANEDTPIGTIHGCEVYGSYHNEPGQSYHGQLYGVEVEWNGRTIDYRLDSDTLNIDPMECAELVGDIHLDDWRWLRALAQTDVVEQLIALACGDVEPPAPAPLAVPATPRPARRRQPADVPIAVLSNGITVMGEFSGDNNTPGCVYLKTDDGCFFCDDTGHLSGCWSGVDFEIEPEALPAISTLFTSTMLPALQNIAWLWGGSGGRLSVPECRMTACITAFTILGHLERNQVHYGLSTAAAGDLADFIAKTIDRELGCVDFEELDVLEQVIAQRKQQITKQAA